MNIVGLDTKSVYDTSLRGDIDQASIFLCKIHFLPESPSDIKPLIQGVHLPNRRD